MVAVGLGLLLAWFGCGVAALRIFEAEHVDVDDSSTREATIAFGLFALTAAVVVRRRRRCGRRAWEEHRR